MPEDCLLPTPSAPGTSLEINRTRRDTSNPRLPRCVCGDDADSRCRQRQNRNPIAAICPERHLARAREPRWTLRLEESQVSETSEAPTGTGRNSDYQSSSGPVWIMSPSAPVGGPHSRTLWRSGLTAPHRQPPASGLLHYGIPRYRRLE